MLAGIIACSLSTFIATNFQVSGMKPISLRLAAVVWVYSIFCFLVQDVLKWVAFRIIDCWETKPEDEREGPIATRVPNPIPQIVVDGGKEKTSAAAAESKTDGKMPLLSGRTVKSFGATD